jgi:prepilin-type N-terminal cleavage/methylation domain-containing protein
MNTFKKSIPGFTLIEILVTIVILAILVGITVVALNPGQNIDDANDVKRKADVTTILDAVWQYAVNNNGAFPTGITTTAKEITNGAGGADLCALITPTYMSKIPADPTTGSFTSCAAYSSKYTIKVDATGKRLTVGATLTSGAYSQDR